MNPEKFIEKFSEASALRQQVKNLQTINRKLKAENTQFRAVIGKMDEVEKSALYWHTFCVLSKNDEILPELEKEIKEAIGDGSDDPEYVIKLIKYIATRESAS